MIIVVITSVILLIFLCPVSWNIYRYLLAVYPGSLWQIMGLILAWIGPLLWLRWRRRGWSRSVSATVQQQRLLLVWNGPIRWIVTRVAVIIVVVLLIVLRRIRRRRPDRRTRRTFGCCFVWFLKGLWNFGRPITTTSLSLSWTRSVVFVFRHC